MLFGLIARGFAAMDRAQGCAKRQGSARDGFGAEYYIPQTPAKAQQTALSQRSDVPLRAQRAGNKLKR